MTPILPWSCYFFCINGSDFSIPMTLHINLLYNLDVYMYLFIREIQVKYTDRDKGHYKGGTVRDKACIFVSTKKG